MPEVLVAHQLDLDAQLEKQLRAVHHTMRRIEQLRGARRRRGGSVTLSNGARENTLDHLSAELTSIDTELDTQHELCLEMQTTVEKMRARLRAMRMSFMHETAWVNLKRLETSLNPGFSARTGQLETDSWFFDVVLQNPTSRAFCPARQRLLSPGQRIPRTKYRQAR